jgi:hypothetical protein
LSNLDFEPCNLTACMCDSGKDVTREQAHREHVRVVKNDRVADCQVKRRSGRHGRSHRGPNIRCVDLHSPRCCTSAAAEKTELVSVGIPSTIIRLRRQVQL